MPKLQESTRSHADLYIFYFLWPVIVAPKEIQFIIIAAILFDLLRRHRLYFDTIGYFMVVFIFIYFLSIIYNLTGNTYELDRIFATINTFSLWIFSLFFYLLFKNIPVDINRIIAISFVNYLLLIVLWIGSLGISVLTNSGSFGLMTRNLYYTEWFGGMEVIRFVAFMDYPNLIIMFFMFFYPLYLLYTLNLRNEFLKIALIIIGILPVITTFSRSGYVIILAYLSILVVFFLYKKLNIILFISVTFFSFSLILPIILYTNLPSSGITVLHELFNAREGSNDSRAYLMKESIRVAMETSPLIGMGIKITSMIGYPLGSHSTFAGFIYRTGILGFLAGSIMFLMIAIKMLWNRGNLKNTIMKLPLLLMLPLFVVEDIDGSNWLVIFYFLLVALTFNTKKIPEQM